ncbi:MAG: hypothetical protein J5911_02785 [Clostridia bacterium]|nr:hypothetical protein [Clostridia bacterium]
MTISAIIALITALAMIISVLFKPYLSFGKAKVGLYVIICVAGAACELIFGELSFSQALAGISADSSVNPLKILALFLSMTLISVCLGDSGFFHLVAKKAFTLSKGKNLSLFFILYAVVSALTVFTSNDIVILTFTPIICIFCKKSGVSPVPFLIGEFVAANTWSMALIVGNPTNVYLAQSAGVSFADYFKVMALPALAAGVTAFIVLFALFGKTLSKKSAAKVPDGAALASARVNLPCMVAALIALIGVIIALALANLIGVEMWLITVIFASALLLFNIVYGVARGEGLVRAASGIKKTPWELVPFILSMFVIVLSLEKSGITESIAAALVKSDKTDGAAFGFLSAGLSNLLNNIPTSVITEKIIAGKSLAATYGAVIGTNIGAFITPVGALAGIMWTKILSGYGIKLPFRKFFVFGVTVAIPTLFAATFTLFLVL